MQRIFDARAVREDGMRGLKVHGYDAAPTREVCDAVRRLRIPLLVDVVGRAYLIELLAPQYPDVNFIIPHLGSFAETGARVVTESCALVQAAEHYGRFLNAAVVFGESTA